VRYNKDVWSWEGLDEWEALEFTRFEALLINISRNDHSTDNGGHRFQKSEIVRIMPYLRLDDITYRFGIQCSPLEAFCILTWRLSWSDRYPIWWPGAGSAMIPAGSILDRISQDCKD
jgi:hypothetical protein